MYNNQKIQNSPMPLKVDGEFFYMTVVQVDFVETHRPSLCKIYLGEDLVRRFTWASLPKHLKVKFTMIHALPPSKLKEDSQLYEIDMYHAPTYVTNSEFNSIGWRVSNSMYVIVLSGDEIKQILGETVDA